ncbi:MAG: Gfo/Idh/MocA family protein, partial [Flavobacteriales bacterium]
MESAVRREVFIRFISVIKMCAECNSPFDATPLNETSILRSKEMIMNRRDFVKTTSIATTGALLTPSMAFGNARSIDKKIRIGMIAVGFRGQSHIDELLKRTDVELVAFADPDARMMADAQALLAKAGKQKAAEYGNGDYGYRDMLQRDDIDAVIVSSPWEWHARHGCDAMRAGKIVGMEVCGGMSLGECWEYVRTYEQTGIPIMMLENVCYRR